MCQDVNQLSSQTDNVELETSKDRLFPDFKSIIISPRLGLLLNLLALVCVH